MNPRTRQRDPRSAQRLNQVCPHTRGGEHEVRPARVAPELHLKGELALAHLAYRHCGWWLGDDSFSTPGCLLEHAHYLWQIDFVAEVADHLTTAHRRSGVVGDPRGKGFRSAEHTSELQSLMRI